MNTYKEESNNSKYIQTAIEIIQKPILTTRDIAKLTGYSLYTAKRIRKDIIAKEKDYFFYTAKASIRTDHFLKYYQNDYLSKLYEDVFMWH